MSTPTGPRPGLAGIADRLLGPDATTGEQAVTYATAVLGTAGVVAIGLLHHQQWALWHYALVAVVGFDLIGGASANATDTARRLWHRPGREARHHLGFVLAHLHPFVLAALVPGYGWTAAATTYALIVLGALAVVTVPADLRRPTAFAAAALTVTVVTSLPGTAVALAWFGPVLVVKLLLAHLPADGRASR
ncbi:hypothetical protein [Nocardiopsis ansamitocini]|uniref:Uncharacterized protein n=1 Tax=Nocardiopsis ansamitocini TaxID=1670832 RepID=A0A9W6UKR3_9ACTN|nr:hypothetical protein [Nocardiopsis ansamitocini]GLU49997.1 hypothetical protein Nans01_43480 [Nocardiopsis ansamitocini]